MGSRRRLRRASSRLGVERSFSRRPPARRALDSARPPHVDGSLSPHHDEAFGGGAASLSIQTSIRASTTSSRPCPHLPYSPTVSPRSAGHRPSELGAHDETRRSPNDAKPIGGTVRRHGTTHRPLTCDRRNSRPGAQPSAPNGLARHRRCAERRRTQAQDAHEATR